MFESSSRESLHTTTLLAKSTTLTIKPTISENIPQVATVYSKTIQTSPVVQKSQNLAYANFLVPIIQKAYGITSSQISITDTRWQLFSSTAGSTFGVATDNSGNVIFQSNSYFVRANPSTNTFTEWNYPNGPNLGPLAPDSSGNIYGAITMAISQNNPTGIIKLNTASNSFTFWDTSSMTPYGPQSLDVDSNGNVFFDGGTFSTCGTNPTGVAYDSGKGEVFVTGDTNTDGTVCVISDSSNTVVATVSIGSDSYPVGVAYDSGKGEVFVANFNSNSVSVISDSSNTVVATIPVGSGPRGIAYDSGKGEVFVGNQNDGTVSIISDTSNSVTNTISVGSSPVGLAYDSGKGEVFVTNGKNSGGSVSVISDSSNTVVATVSIDGYPTSVAYDSGKGEIFIGGEESVSVISDSSNTVVATVSVGNADFGIAYDSGKGEVFVTNANSGSVSVISDSSNTVVATIPVGSGGPLGVAYDSGKGEVFVANSADNSVSVISDSSNTVVATVTVVGYTFEDQVNKLNPSTNAITTWTFSGWVITPFAIDGSGNCYFVIRENPANSTSDDILSLNPSTNTITTWAIQQNIADLTISPNGNLFFVVPNAGGINNMIAELNPSANTFTEWTVPLTSSNNGINQLTEDSSGNIFFTYGTGVGRLVISTSAITLWDQINAQYISADQSGNVYTTIVNSGNFYLDQLR